VWEVELEKICKELEPTVALDGLGGDFSGALVKALKEKGTLINYGTSAGVSMSNIDPKELIMRKITLKGFNFSDFL